MEIVIDEERCVGCGICVQMCPEEVLAMEGEKARVVNKEQCEECKACEVNCEYEAIKCIE